MQPEQRLHGFWLLVCQAAFVAVFVHKVGVVELRRQIFAKLREILLAEPVSFAQLLLGQSAVRVKPDDEGAVGLTLGGKQGGAVRLAGQILRVNGKDVLDRLRDAADPYKGD